MANKKFSEEVSLDVNWDTFRMNLRRLIETRGMTPADLSKKTHISASTISRYFTERSPDLTSAWILADFFDVTIDWLVGRSQERYDILPEDARKIADEYLASCPADKKAVELLLSKYEKP